MPADTPTIVFVHGAWADASGFGESIRVLRDRGIAAIGFANPLRHLTGDAAYLATPEGPRAWAASHASMVFAAGSRDAADPECRRGDKPQPRVRV
jgi:hypothetical protein